MFCTMLWYIVVQIFFGKSGAHWGKWGTLWYKYTLEKVDSHAKVGALEKECSSILNLLNFPPPLPPPLPPPPLPLPPPPPLPLPPPSPPPPPPY